MPRVTVAIPTYNRAAYLMEALASVLAQDHPDFDVLVVDNCSTDDTPEHLATVCDPRLRWVRNESNLGPIGNNNRCMELATGDYLYLMHDDDQMEPENLSRKAALLDAFPNLAFVHSGFRVMDGAGQVVTARYEDCPDYDLLLPGDVFVRHTLAAANTVCCPTVMMRREHAIALGGFDPSLPWAGDVELWARLAMRGDVGFLRAPLLRYRVHASNDSRGFDNTARALYYDILCKRSIARQVQHRFVDTEALLSAGIMLLVEKAIAAACSLWAMGRSSEARDCVRLVLWATPQALPELQAAGLMDLVTPANGFSEHLWQLAQAG